MDYFEAKIACAVSLFFLFISQSFYSVFKAEEMMAFKGENFRFPRNKSIQITVHTCRVPA